MAYYRLEPFGEDRADYRNGMLMKLVAELATNEEHDIGKFIPSFGAEPMTPEDVDAKVVQTFQLFAKKMVN